jgi:hypothetical protein
MGMFDEIHCDAALPDDACEAGTCFQTKSLPDPCMCRYRITASGRSSIQMVIDLEPSGYITFYAYPKDRSSGWVRVSLSHHQNQCPFRAHQSVRNRLTARRAHNFDERGISSSSIAVYASATCFIMPVFASRRASVARR